jgi:hypothetical protein
MRKILAVGLMLALVTGFAPGSSAAAKPKPRVSATVLCYRDTGTYEITWRVKNPQRGKKMKILSTSRDLHEFLPGTTSGTLVQRVVVMWKWREDGRVQKLRGTGKATFGLDGSCRVPDIEVVVVSTNTPHTAIAVSWGTLGSSSDATNVLTPWRASVEVDLDYDVVSLAGQEWNGTNATLECSIRVDDQVVERSSASGPYSICSVAESFELSEPVPVEPAQL